MSFDISVDENTFVHLIDRLILIIPVIITILILIKIWKKSGGPPDINIFGAALYESFEIVTSFFLFALVLTRADLIHKIEHLRSLLVLLSATAGYSTFLKIKDLLNKHTN